MITLDNQPTQQHMEKWYGQLADKSNPLLHTGALAAINPKFVSCDLAKKEAVFTFLADPWQLYPDGTIHSGLVTMHFDTAFGLLCHYFAKQHMICTVNLTTSLLQPIPSDKAVWYRAKILSLGKSIITLRGEAFLPENPTEILATADTTFMILNKMLEHKI